MTSAITAVKSIISGTYRTGYTTFCDSNYNRIWLFTNENIRAYLGCNNFKENESVLTVLASGDQAFNLITKGIENIDTFDVNKFTEYYALGLKRALILKYDYEDFIKIVNMIYDYNTPAKTIVEIINEASLLMDKKYRDFWTEIGDYYYKLDNNSYQKHNLFMMLGFQSNIIKNIINRNNYLTNRESYNILKSSLTKTNLTFTHANAANLTDYFKGPYDYLLLSNILDYIQRCWGACWTKERLDAYLKKLKTLMNDDGLIYLYYSFDPRKIDGTKLSIKDFDKDEILTIMDNYGPESQTENAVLLKRAKDI